MVASVDRDSGPQLDAGITGAELAALAYAFNVLKKDRVISLIHPDNRASIRVAERIGETLQGRIAHLGREMLCYGIDREVYPRERVPIEQNEA